MSATHFTTFATPARTTTSTHPQSSTKRRSATRAPSTPSPNPISFEDARPWTPSTSIHQFTYSCSPHSSHTLASCSSPPRPAAPLLPSLPIFAGARPHLTSSPMRRSPGMHNLNFFTRSAFAEEKAAPTLGSGMEAWRKLGDGCGLGLVLDSPLRRVEEREQDDEDSGFFSSPELRASPSSSSGYNSSPPSCFDDEESSSDPSTSPDWDRLTHSSTPPTPYTPFDGFQPASSCKSPSPADGAGRGERDQQLVSSPRVRVRLMQQDRRVGGSWEADTEEGVGLGLGLGLAF